MFVSPFVKIRKGHKLHAQFIREVKAHGCKVFVTCTDSKLSGVTEHDSPEEAEDVAQNIMEQVEKWLELSQTGTIKKR